MRIPAWCLAGVVLLVQPMWAQPSDIPIEVRGGKWSWNCVGTGHPTVVFESGVGSSAGAWSLVQGRVGEFVRACTYVRPESQAIGFEQRAADLRDLLAGTGETGPWLLVGHSHGGYVVRLFAASWPGDTAGIVLVDSTPESLAIEAEGLMPENHRQMWIRSEEEIRDKLQDLELPDLPLIVLSSEQLGIPLAMAEGYQIDRLVALAARSRQALAKSVPRGEHRLVKDTGHFIHRDRPETVVEAIRKVWQQARQD